ncbi:CLUMA_CG012537, isoform A [Clunio marinus]|uniref:CLUMA_CG012537, isoform A n=1 Tax=Clunio marinus TaxID=568069 RepID=A0A1J1IHZ7_9DIPT|nr:CLUMA_CG012537, isoform A [Clunio marinus]
MTQKSRANIKRNSWKKKKCESQEISHQNNSTWPSRVLKKPFPIITKFKMRQRSRKSRLSNKTVSYQSEAQNKHNKKTNENKKLRNV